MADLRWIKWNGEPNVKDDLWISIEKKRNVIVPEEPTSVSAEEMSEIMRRDPLELSKQDVDAIVAEDIRLMALSKSRRHRKDPTD
jgi:hypothetical protein